MIETLDYAPMPRRYRPTFPWTALAWRTALIGSLILLACSYVKDCFRQAVHTNSDVVKARIGPNGSLSLGIDLFVFNTGRWPKSLNELVTAPVDEPARRRWTGPYLKDASGLLDPWNHPFRYLPGAPTGEPHYLLWSLGPDGVGGTPDDIRNW